MSNEKNLPYAVVCGGVNIDIGAHSFAPLRAKDSNPGKVELSLGGVGRNIAHNMRLLGVPTYLLTAVGGDSRASQVEESCKELGIDLSHALRVPDGRTSTYVFVGDSDGDMAVAVADMEICEKLTPDYFASQKELLDGAAAVVLLFVCQHCAPLALFVALAGYQSLSPTPSARSLRSSARWVLIIKSKSTARSTPRRRSAR